MSNQQIPQAFIADVNDRADLVAMIGSAVQLKKSGAHYKGRCPFHNEKSPSFIVSPVRQNYHCFGCGAHGNAISWLMDHDGYTFVDAVRELAALAGIPMPDRVAAPTHELNVDRSSLFAAMQKTQDFYFNSLMNSPQCQPARDYARKRGITRGTLKTFLMGAAPPGWQPLREAFGDYESNADLVNCGLVKLKAVSNSEERRYDTFRNRLTFGVRDIRGRIVAFGGRALGDGEEDQPKYLNSPESPIFDKSNTLFGLYESRDAIRRMKCVYVVEGYMDVIMLHQHKVSNAVAALGTAFTEQHYTKLIGHTSEPIFCFDGDAAGIKAAWRTLEVIAPLVKDDQTPRFMVLPDNMDPDEYVQAHGAAEFFKIGRNAPGFAQYLLSTLANKHNNLATIDDRARFTKEAQSIISNIACAPVLKRLLFREVQHLDAGQTLPVLDAARTRNTKDPLWERLVQAVERCPDVALTLRADLISALKSDHPGQLLVIDALKGIDPDSPHPNTTSLEYARAKGVLDKALELIDERNIAEETALLRSKFQSGEISDVEYAKGVLTLRQPSSSRQ